VAECRIYLIVSSSDYVADLMTEVVVLREEFPSYKKAKILVKRISSGVPNTLSATCPTVSKEDMVESFQSRFNNL
jgi:hypothetical protein